MGLKEAAAGIPIIGGLFDSSADDAMDEIKKNGEIYKNIALPSYEQYRPEEYQYSGDLDPRLAQASQVSEDPRIRGAQMSALMKMAGLADDGLSSEDALAFDNARSLGAQQSQQGAQAALQNASARGVGGSGLEYAMGAMANQEGANRAHQAGLEQAAATAKNRVLYNQAYGDALAGVRGQDMTAGSKNADILNQFNLANTQTQNQAQARNLDARQTTGNANVDAHNQAFQYNQGNQTQAFNNEMARAGGQSGANTAAANQYNAQGAANQSARNGILGAGASIYTGIKNADATDNLANAYRGGKK
jgi:hypothetical protein